MTRTLVTGGVRSGKSAWAERALAECDVTYVATAGAYPDDPEWRARIAEHRARRPSGWRTVESGDVAGLLRTEPGPLLVDDLGNWLTGAFDDAGAWDEPARREVVRARAEDLVAAWESRTSDVVAVTNEVGWGVVPASAAGRAFRDELGTLNAALAAASDRVMLLVAGLPMRLR